MINVISWCIFGLVVGGIARLLVPGRQPIGCLGTIFLGVIGSIIGGTLWTVISGRPLDELQYGGFFASILGGVIALSILRWVVGPRY